MIKLKRNKAQSIAEYSFFIGAILAVLIGMNVYFQRKGNAIMEAGLNKAPLHMVGTGDQVNNIFGEADQYVPEYAREGQAEWTNRTREGVKSGVSTEDGGRTVTTGAQQEREGYSVVPAPHD